jgi:hypothetical protein
MSNKARWDGAPMARSGFLLLLLALGSRLPALPSEFPNSGKSVSEVATTALRLNAIEDTGLNAPGYGWTGKVAAAARPLLTTFKRQLRELIGRELNQGAGEGSPEEIRARLISALAREGVPLAEVAWDTDHPYGWLMDLEVRRLAGLDRWLAFVVKQSLVCGFDESLYLFERGEEGWRLAFALEANDYEEIHDGLMSLDFATSLPDRGGRFFLVVADINPACASNWQRIRYRAFRLGGDPLHPQPFFVEEESIFERSFELSVAADRFRITFPGHQSLDFGILIRNIVRAYRITGTKAERIGPLAEEERGFIDEWISQPWRIAGRWTSIPTWESLRAWHYKLQGMLQDENLYAYTEFGPLVPCGPSRSLGVLYLEGDQPAESAPAKLFFTIQLRGDDFEMERIDVAEPEGCTAPREEPSKPTGGDGAVTFQRWYSWTSHGEAERCPRRL